MALLTNQLYETKVLDRSKNLPFTLVLSVGSGYQVETIPLTKVVENPQAITDCHYRVTELKDLKLRFQAVDTSIEVEVRWDHVQKINKEKAFTTYGFSFEEPEQVLYENKGDGEAYPWRCGWYHFEIIYQGIPYFGGIEITPKNVNNQQMTKIHDLINQELEGLVTDYVSYKNTFGCLAGFQAPDMWRFLTWHQSIEKKLLNALREIEKRSQMSLTKTYKIENTPHHLDNRSIRWQHSDKGVVYQQAKFYNRRYENRSDNDENRMVKYAVYRLLHKMDEALDIVNKMSLERHKTVEAQRHEIEKLMLHHTQMEASRMITLKDKKRMEEAISIKRLETEQSKTHLRLLEDDFLAFKASQLNLSAHLSTPFWNQVANRRPMQFVLGKIPAYQLIYELWKESEGLREEGGEGKLSMPVHKPTSLLYEYYVFFGTLQMLRGLDFLPDRESVTVQLQKSFFKDGLKDGTKVWFIKDNLKVSVTYDEMIELTGDLALEKETPFFSLGSRRKPDIRMDLYRVKEDKRGLDFLSSFVIEVKYSPFHNIYQRAGNTKAIEQMKEYWQISFVYMVNGKKEFNRRVVKNVICVYPGDEHQPLTHHEDSGIFQQYYPNPNTDDPYDIVGFQELSELIKEWVEEA